MMNTTENKLIQYLAAITLAILICSPGCISHKDSIVPPPDISPQQPNVVSLDPKDWYIFYSAGMVPRPLAYPEAAWSFLFPTSGHVNYIQTPFNTTTIPHNVYLSFRVDSDAPQYVVIDPADILPATVRVFFEQQNDNLINADGRWWAEASVYNLGSHDNSTITLVVPFDPSRWSNVEGQFDPPSFYAAWNNVGWIGITCGGQYFFGHGVALGSGSARYILIDFHLD